MPTLEWIVIRRGTGWSAMLFRGSTYLDTARARTRIGLRVAMWWLSGTVRHTRHPVVIRWP